MDARNAALQYLARGWAPLPVPRGSKNPGFAEWQKFTCAPDKVHRHFPPAGNIGLLLGTPSGGLGELDLATPEAVWLAKILAPPTGVISGRAGNEFSHYWYYSDPPDIRRSAFSYPPNDGTAEEVMLVELRATGCQTLVLPSVH